jgi:hypothetical protein
MFLPNFMTIILFSVYNKWFKGESKMRSLIGNIKMISFQLKWMFLSPQQRYAHLWERTKKLDDWGYSIKNLAAVASK